MVKKIHEVFVTLSAVKSGKKKNFDGMIGTQSMLMLLPINDKLSDDSACIVGKTSSTETAISSKVTCVAVTTGSTIFTAQTKSLAGITWASGNLMVGIVHVDALNVALIDTTAVCSGKDFFPKITSTFIYEKETRLGPIALRRLMPLMPNAFSAITRLGGLANLKVKHVSRIDEENERAGHGLHKSSTMLVL